MVGSLTLLLIWIPYLAAAFKAQHHAVTAIHGVKARPPPFSTPLPKLALSLSVGGRCSPADQGGDPTGQVDSTKAIQACISFCNRQCEISPNGFFPGSRSFGNGKAVRDCGGCVVDLDGGEYLISDTIDIPEYTGNIEFGYGSIIGSKDFPSNKFLLTVGGVSDGCHVPQGSCNVDINFPYLFLDGSNIAKGLMQLNNVMGSTIGPGGYFLNFTSYGIQINGGHEAMISRVWLGETNFDFDYEGEKVVPTATAIEINGNDHFVLDTVVFSSKVGVAVNGAANVLTNVHVWFPLNRALAFRDQGVMAFHVTAPQNRFTGCYIDGNVAVFDNTVNQVWTNGFECCAGLNVPRGIILRGDVIGPGFVITNNIWEGGSIYHEPATPNKQPTIKNVFVAQNTFSSNGRGTRASISLSQSNATKWTFDFCGRLLFPLNVQKVSVTLVAEEGFPRHIVRPNSQQACKVVVETDMEVTGTMTADVDSSQYDNTFM